ncbi:MAG: hypothetical protein O2960_29045 [Verrucomicrobia bacterium]|nr:hypothetical protein [Verrucomicrobiota bacterium]
MSWIDASSWRKGLFSVFLGWSIVVQFVGAFAYDLISWHKVEGMNIDRPEYRHRLWSWKDCEIAYYMAHFSESRARRPGW